MDIIKESKLMQKYLDVVKSVVRMAVKAVIVSFLIGIFAIIKIYFNGFKYRNILLIGGAALAFITMIIYGVLVTLYNDKEQDNRLKLVISFCGFFPFIYGYYLILFEFILWLELLLKEFSIHTALTGLFFLSAGIITINGINKISKLQTNIDEKFCFINWFFSFLLVLFALPRLIGGLSSLLNTFRLEVPFVLFWYWHFCSVQKKNSLQPYIAAAPILLFYIVFDLYYIAFGKIFKIIDIKGIPELIKVLPLPYVAIGVTLIVIPACLYLVFIDYKKYNQIVTGIIIAFCLFFTVKYTPGVFLKVFKFTAKGVTQWSDKKSAEDNGRFMMILYSMPKMAALCYSKKNSRHII